jgi:HEPN domain-containing protein
MTSRPPDPRAAAIRQYTRQAVELRATAKEALAEGWYAWAYEWEDFAIIAERAALAEVVDRRPK